MVACCNRLLRIDTASAEWHQDVGGLEPYTQFSSTLNMDTPRTSLTNRLITGFLFAFFVGITSICVPIALLLLTRGKAIQLLGLFKGFPIWESTLLAIAGIMGVALGPDRSMELLGHLWGIERPRRTGITIGLWIFFISIALCGYWIAGQRHGI